MILYESDNMHKHHPERSDFSEPLLLGADHQLSFLFSFRSTLNSELNPSNPGELAGQLPR